MATDVKAKYYAVSALTITLTSLANDSTNLLAGRQSTVVDNSSNLYPDYKLSGRITTGTSPVAGNTIEIWAFSQIDDSPTYPDVLGATDAAVTLTSSNVKNAALRHVLTITVDVTNNRPYDFSEISIARLFNGVPKKFGVVVINGSGAALNATGGNHFLNIQPDGYSLV